MKRLITTAVLAAMAMTATAADELTAKDWIKFRQSGYTFMAWNMYKIRGQLANPATMDKNVVVAAANAIAGVANSGMGALYLPGTEKGEGWIPTKVKPELFQKPDEVKKVATDFNKAANQLQMVAASGDAKSIGQAFEALGKTCKNCHDSFKNK